MTIDQVLKLFKNGEHQAAINMLEQLCLEEPNDKNVAGLAGKIYFFLGHFERAIFHLERMQRHFADDPELLFNLATCYRENKNFIKSIDILSRYVNIFPNDAIAWLNLSEAQMMANDLKAALDSVNRALRITPKAPEAFLNQGVILRKLGKKKKAMISYEAAINLNPAYSEAWNNLAEVQYELGRNEEALRSCNEAFKFRQDYPEAWFNHGNILSSLDRPNEALVSYQHASVLRPNYDKCLLATARLLSLLCRHDEALEVYRTIIHHKPDSYDAWYGHGIILDNLKRHEEASRSYKKAIELNSELPSAWKNCGVALIKTGRAKEALTYFDTAIKIKNDDAQAWYNKGIALYELGCLEESLDCYKSAIKIDPIFGEAWNNAGVVANDLNRHENALNYHEQALKINPNIDFVLGAALHLRMELCLWEGLEQKLNELSVGILEGRKVTNPFVVVARFDSPSLQQRAAEIYLKEKVDFSVTETLDHRQNNKKIRLGYFSMDFSNHPVAQLSVELFEGHSRNNFEIFGFSYGPNTQDMMRKRLEKAFDQFIDVEKLGSSEIISLSRELGIDIAVDLGGHTRNSRPQIFAGRAAPIQISYLGYPATWGDACMDYFIGDDTTISESNRQYFSEKIIYLTNQFQVNPSSRPTPSQNKSRVSFGLPEEGFIFCSFNNNWKISPEIFDIWLRILRKTPGSVLWLSLGSSRASQNLVNYAASQGIDSTRLIFAEKLPNFADHLARYQLADLFLDTFPYGAHTTASDALWAGLPVLTRVGASFASRVAASLLETVGVPELITGSAPDYERFAVKLASDATYYLALRQKLRLKLSSSPLFDSTLFKNKIEEAYLNVHQRHRAGLSPVDIRISHV
jgi:predicted O-linked N-acetylglucosamine transferase (SPINDLY family)